MLKRGDTVRLSPYAKECGFTITGRIGIVVSCKLYVRVLWNGLKHPQAYYPDFIERVPDDAPLQPEIVARFSHVEITPGVVDIDADATPDPTSNARRIDHG